MSEPLLTVLLRVEQDVVTARQRARHVAEQLGYDEQDSVRVATAVSEIARNAYRYAGGGRVEFFYQRGDPSRLQILVTDSGPGIPNLADLLAGKIGRGRGLLGCRRLMDEFDVQSAPGKGTCVRLVKHWRIGQKALSESEIQRVSEQLRQRPIRDAVQELQRQNLDLLATLEESQRNREQLERVNRELDETNRGVMALYAELDDRADSLRRASEAKTRFLSGMTHELRSPLNSILSLSRMLADRMDGELTAEQAKQVSYIQKAASSLSDLVNDLLDIAKVEAGKLTVRVTDFPVGELLSSLRGTTRPLLTRPEDVALIFEETAAHLWLRTDEGRLAQILRNLISNAIKFTEKGEVRIRAREVSTEMVEFQIVDTGIGIDLADQERIFEEFTQIENPLQTKLKGTGLGLSLSKQLTRLLGGTLTLHSEKGRGSTFTVMLPRSYAGDASAIAPFAATVPAVRPGRLIQDTQEVLIADDDEISRYLIRGVFANESCSVVEANSGEHAMELLQVRRPGLLIVDFVMPGMSGLSVIERLRAANPTRELPIILHTAAPLTAHDLDVAAHHGAIYVPKKYDDRLVWEAQLREAVNRSGIHLLTTAR